MVLDTGKFQMEGSHLLRIFLLSHSVVEEQRGQERTRKELPASSPFTIFSHSFMAQSARKGPTS